MNICTQNLPEWIVADADFQFVLYVRVRNSWPGEDANTPAVHRDDGLPAIWIFSPMIDRLRRTSDGWKIFERYVGESTVNKTLDPPEAK
jgi:hypothetical protein